MSTAGYRGCAFIAAATEAPRGGLVEVTTENQRAWMRSLFVDLARGVGASRPGVLAQQLQMVYDGVSISTRLEGDASVFGAARAMVESLVGVAR